MSTTADMVPAENEKRKGALSSVLAAIFLTTFKIIVGAATGSLGILAEAAHSALDLVAALVTFFAVRFSDRPPYEEHPYGHGKIENLSDQSPCSPGASARQRGLPLGFANSRSQARQLVRHSHFLVNGNRVNVPSYLVGVGDRVEVKEKSRDLLPIRVAVEAVARRGVPQWLEVDKEKLVATVKSLPAREDLTMPIQEQLIVEHYSK